MRTVKVLIAASASGLVLATGAATASAAARHHHTTAAANEYGGVQGGQTGGPGVLGEQAGGLPFTGMNLLLFIGAGSGLIASGIGLRRASLKLRS
jgi:hypothetical protein